MVSFTVSDFPILGILILDDLYFDYAQNEFIIFNSALVLHKYVTMG